MSTIGVFMLMAKCNFHANGLQKWAGEILSDIEMDQIKDLKSKMLGNSMIEEFNGQEGDEKHLGWLSAEQLKVLILKKDKKARMGKSVEGLRSLYASYCSFEDSKPKKKAKAKKEKKEKAE